MPEEAEEGLREVAPITEQFAGQALGQFRQRLTIIDVTGSDPKGEQFPTIDDHEMKFETIKPA